MIKKLMHNWQWKLLALVISFVFWAMIVNIQDPTKTLKIDDIPVEITNIDEITSRGLAIEYKDGETVDIVLEGKRSIIQNMTIEDVKAYADFGRVSVTGAVDIIIDAGDQVEVIRKIPNEMIIDTEEIKKEVKSVQVRYIGSLAKNYIKLSALVTPNQIEVTGPESKLALVSSVVVPIDISDAIDDVIVSRAPQLLDSSGNEVREVEISQEQIQVSVPVQKTRVVPVVIDAVGEINPNYRLISMAAETSEVTVRGEAEEVDNFTQLTIGDVDLRTLTEASKTKEINLLDYLEEGIYLYKGGPRTQVEFDVQLIINSSYTIEQEDINVRRIPEGLSFQFIEEEPVVVGVKGIFSELQNLEVEDMMAQINLDGLEVGTHTLPLELTMPTGFELSTEVPTIKVELTEETEEVIDTGEQSSEEATTEE